MTESNACEVEGTSLRDVVECFPLGGALVDVVPLTRGHIHDTYVSTWAGSGGRRRFLHQRMNEAVFPDLDLLMHNIRTVSEHMVERLGREGADGFEPLHLIPTREGETYARVAGRAWRTFVFIDGAESHDRCEGPEQAFEAARAFAWFQRQLLDLPSEALGETLKEFFSSPARFAQFEAALARSSATRRASAGEEIEFVLRRAAIVGVIEAELASGAMPRRIVHGDTKLNNILFDEETGRAKGIVDLDTCMGGYSLYDFGDLVRFTAATSAEDERDLACVGTDLELYRALADGYLSMAGDFLTPHEIELMPFAARLVTFTIGMRFLADHLAGDRYFKIARPGHNLDRARVQFAMVAFMEANQDAMRIR